MYKNLLVHLDEGADSESRLGYAITLAQRCEAHLAGVHVGCEPSWPVYAYGPLPGEAVAALQKHVEAVAADARTAYEAACTAAGISVDFRGERVAEYQVGDRLALHARHADLMIMGQSNAEAGERAGGNDLPEHVVLASGRPVLLVPYIGLRQPPGERVMVAWNGSREAARALNDAMPLLRQAKSVVVLSVNAEQGAGDFGDLPGADIALHLARHGVQADVQRAESGSVDPANLILSRIADLGTDLLVMGAYGRSRLREMIMGGVSRTILQEMTVPVFLSH